MIAIHYENSSYREKLLEHLFIGDILRYLWVRGVTSAEFLRPEVDNGGYDLVVTCNGIIRHIQLKASYNGSSVREQKVHLRLMEKPSGCVVWLLFDPDSLQLGPFLWFGGAPGAPLPDLTRYPVARHTKGNAQGITAERPSVRVLKRADFELLGSIPDVAERLFGLVVT
jgi:hypothetical protein